MLIYLMILCTVFNTHPRNTTVIYGSVASFQCSYIPSDGGVISAPPSWIVTPPSGFATQTLRAMGERQGQYFYALGSATNAVLQVQVQREIPGLNETCFVCSFNFFGATQSGRGCLNIASKRNIHICLYTSAMVDIIIMQFFTYLAVKT